MAKAPDPGGVQPSADRGRSLDALHIDVARIQVDADYTKRSLGELQTDVRDLRDQMSDLRDRMTRLEVRVEHLPSKGFIVLVVSTSLVVAGGLATIAPKLSGWAGIPAWAMSAQQMFANSEGVALCRPSAIAGGNASSSPELRLTTMRSRRRSYRAATATGSVARRCSARRVADAKL